MCYFIWNKVNKRFLLAGGLIVIGILGMIDVALAGYQYHHNPQYNDKFQGFVDSSSQQFRYGHPHYRDYQTHRKNYYKKHHFYNDHDYYSNHTHRYHKHYNEKRRHYSYRGKAIDSRSNCFNYRVTTYGGIGGFRFQHNIQDFKRITNGSHTGVICGRNNVEFELSKLNPSVRVSIEINGKHFLYAAHSGHDRYINNWHRKYFSLNLYY